MEFIEAMSNSRNSKQFLLAFACALAVITMTGCSSTGAKVTRAPGFGINMLQREGLLCAGVTALGGGEYAPGDTASSRFEAALKESRPDVRYVGLNEFRTTLGEAEHRTLAKRYSDTENIPEGIWIAATAPGRPAYFLWVNITVDESNAHVSENKDVTYRTVEDTEGNKTQVVDHVDYVTTSRGSRFVTVDFAIYEAATRQRMWHAVIKGGDSNSTSRSSTLTYPAPVPIQPPGAFEVLEEIIERAVKELVAR